MHPHYDRAHDHERKHRQLNHAAPPYRERAKVQDNDEWKQNGATCGPRYGIPRHDRENGKHDLRLAQCRVLEPAAPTAADQHVKNAETDQHANNPRQDGIARDDFGAREQTHYSGATRIDDKGQPPMLEPDPGVALIGPKCDRETALQWKSHTLRVTSGFGFFVR